MKNKIEMLKASISSDKGFTLVELVVAVAILMVLLSMIAPAFYANASSESRTNVIRRNRETSVGALDKVFNQGSGGAGTSETYSVVFKNGAYSVQGNTVKKDDDGYSYSIVVAK